MIVTPLAAPPTVAIPQPTTGPSPRLSLTDPSTMVMLAAVLYALGSQLWHAVTGMAAPPLTLQVTNMIVAGLIVVGGILAKHHLTGQLAQTLVTDAPTLLPDLLALLGQSSNPQPATPQTPAALLADGKAIHAALTTLLATQGPKT